ncbi:MAG: GIY-YIG nuclease family protein [Bilifractor sp.]|jgi:hypothetical protein
MGETLHLYMMDGDADGRWRVEKTKSNCYMYKLSRQDVDKSKNLDYINTPGIYFLYGRDTDSPIPFVYVGQGEHCLDRSIEPHKFESDGSSYWTEVVCFVSNDSHFDQGAISYLENRFWNEIKKAGRYLLKNAVEPHKPKLKDYVADSLEGDILDAKMFMGTIGYPAFVPSVKGIDATGHKDDLLYLTTGSDKWKATAVMSADGFIVLKGSIISDTIAKSCPEKVKQLRKQHQDKINSDHELLENIPFDSPSYAASFVSGYSISGPKEWKNKDGINLGSLSGDTTDETIVPADPAPSAPASIPDQPIQDDGTALYLQYEWTDRKTKQRFIAKCKVSDDAYIVLTNSQIRMSESKGLALKAKTEREHVKKTVSADGISAVIHEDVKFNSASTAGGFVDGGSCNGKTAWKDKTGKTLKELIANGL